MVIKENAKKTANNRLCTEGEYRLWLLLHVTTGTAAKARQKELTRYGLSIIKSGVLYCLDTADGLLTPTEISRLLFREPHTVGSLLRRMEKDGLVSLAKDLHRKNLIRVAMTEKGKQAYANSVQRRSIHKVMSCLTEEEQEQLRSLLRKIRHGSLKEVGYRH